MKDKKLILSIITITIAVAALVLCFAATLSFADSSDTVYCETEEEAATDCGLIFRAVKARAGE